MRIARGSKERGRIDIESRGSNAITWHRRVQKVTFTKEESRQILGSADPLMSNVSLTLVTTPLHPCTTKSSFLSFH